ncbi:TetR family transcriptional regulator [Prauserella flavalba]|uniref:TetR family transcriptional regulator n=1 Tax=Prauserella flavalba TaxID=1477506 RepID=A0A318LC26_9PSEU|nr:TetR family transcriptional regulator [Prauserella flavalba]PXY17647.1 TetR family transcriptional regulator [Prauserella flavalba]PXY21605.1 TetR family transcriptional regulator [Prauserella flavalba]
MTSSSRRTSARKKAEAPAARADGNGERGGEKPARATTARRELVENEMYEQATRLFAERGFAGTSLQDIADAIGITRPALYYYVKSKDELLAKLVTEVTNGPLDELRKLIAGGDLDPVAQLRAIVEIIVRRRATQPARFRLLIRSEAELPEELTSAYDDSRRAVLKTIAEVIEDGIRAGLFRPVDARVAALGVLGMCNWVAWWFHPDGRDNADDVTEQLADMAIAALRRADHHTLDGEGPEAALKMLRQDLDHLERILKN